MDEAVYQRFMTKVNKTENCWLWNAFIFPSGYGSFSYTAKQHKEQRAHRASWILHKGSIPEGLCVLHKCDVRHCVNPDHLFIGTKQDNFDDMIKKKRDRHLKMGVETSKAKLNNNKVLALLRDRKKGLTYKQLSDAYGINKRSVYDILSGRSWACVDRRLV